MKNMTNRPEWYDVCEVLRTRGWRDLWQGCVERSWGSTSIRFYWSGEVTIDMAITPAKVAKVTDELTELIKVVDNIQRKGK